ncbi:RES domain-containing protein [Cohnella lubricantis]|uniref:RES domain-containing protein n=1 Tax=Cohnella lubricantis TaxID=2163172 RepID=A0A841TER8_9BACL|nr:RES domain-containing protein [Cohnella lubricantis]MBB6677798.1 RES domain-containing protein [Cohnella lubricantis]MBP2120485.1 hypothetical protein [Cohnella lubricantis]
MKLNSAGLNEFTHIVSVMSKYWEQVKQQLNEGLVEYDDISNLLETNFFKPFDDMFRFTNQHFKIKLPKIKYIYRAVNESHCNYERFVPKLEYAKEHNRMNPKGKAYFYGGVQAIGYRNEKDRIINTCIKEIRAQPYSTISICRFKPTIMGKDISVIDICGDDTIPKVQDELHEYLFNKYKDLMHQGRDVFEAISIELTKVYFNIFSSDQIFRPIDKSISEQEKLREYAPFHALANYIEKVGNYGGMIFRSTVSDGRNLVLFNPDYVTYIPGTMEAVRVS